MGAIELNCSVHIEGMIAELGKRRIQRRSIGTTLPHYLCASRPVAYNGVMKENEEISDRARGIRLVAMDVDGTLTDGAISLSNEDETKTFFARDGLGISVARHAGIQFAIITGRQSAATERRARELKIEHIIQKCHGKAEALRKLCENASISLEETAFIGDDWNDVPAMRLVGLSAAPGDAPAEITEIADLVTDAAGGRGAVRELVEYLLEAQGGWAVACERWLDSLRAGVETIRQ